MLGSLIVYLKGMRILMFQLSGIYHRCLGFSCGGEDTLGFEAFHTFALVFRSIRLTRNAGLGAGQRQI